MAVYAVGLCPGKEGWKMNKKLWNPGSFVWLSAFFSFYPAAILYSLNWGRLGQPDKQKYGLLASTAGFIAFLAVLYFIPDSMGKSLAVGVNAGIGAFFWHEQKELYAKNVDAHGKASVLPTLAVCIGITAIVIWIMVQPKLKGYKDLTYGKCTLFYEESLGHEEGSKLGKFMKDAGIFDTDNTLDVKLDNSDGYYNVSFVVAPQKRDAPTLEAFKTILDTMRKTIYKGKKARLKLCDDEYKECEIIE
jgi:hypothetical protein